jgi:hypothetical protein
MGARPSQDHGERPEARTDYHHPIALPDPGVGHDGPGEIWVRQEALAQGLGGMDPIPGGEILQGRATKPGATR